MDGERSVRPSISGMTPTSALLRRKATTPVRSRAPKTDRQAMYQPKLSSRSELPAMRDRTSHSGRNAETSPSDSRKLHASAFAMRRSGCRRG